MPVNLHIWELIAITIVAFPTISFSSIALDEAQLMLELNPRFHLLSLTQGIINNVWRMTVHFMSL